MTLSAALIPAVLLSGLFSCIQGDQAGSTPNMVVVSAPTPQSAPQPSQPQPSQPQPSQPAPGAPAAPATAPAFTLLDKPIPFPEERIGLSLDYRRQHQGYAGDNIRIRPEVVVLHWTGGATAQSAWNTFAPVKAADARPDLAASGAVNVSSHFIVDRDGAVWRLMPEDWMARHCIGLNHISIGIENAGDGDLGSDAKNPLTQAQVDANIALIRDLATRWPIRVVVGHLEAKALEGTPLFVESDASYRTGKADPGPRFTAAVRAGLADLGVTGP